MENVRNLLNLMKQNGTQISMSAEEIAEKYNAKIVFKPGNAKNGIFIVRNREENQSKFD